MLYSATWYFNPLNAELNPICHLLALLEAHYILHVSRIRVNRLTLYVTCAYNSQFYLKSLCGFNTQTDSLMVMMMMMMMMMMLTHWNMQEWNKEKKKSQHKILCQYWLNKCRIKQSFVGPRASTKVWSTLNSFSHAGNGQTISRLSCRTLDATHHELPHFHSMQASNRTLQLNKEKPTWCHLLYYFII